MQLNLTMIAGKLTNLTIEDAHLDRSTPRRILYPVLYNHETELDARKLYVARSEDLCPAPVFAGIVSIIVLGRPSLAYQHDLCQIISLAKKTPMIPLFNQLQDIFNEYQMLDKELEHLCQMEDPYKALGDFARNLLGNPVSLYDCHEKVLFYSYDKSRPVYDDEYLKSSLNPGHYMPEGEQELLHTRHGDTYLTVGAQYTSSNDYDLDALYINLRHNDQYLGRFLVENAYRPFQDSDFPTVEWFGNQMYQILLRNEDLYFGKSKAFVLLIQDLVLEHRPLPRSDEKILNSEGWQKNDQYLCAVFSSCSEHPLKTRQSHDALYLNAYFDSHHVLIHGANIIEIVNLSRSKYTREQYDQRLALYLKYSGCIAGLSVTMHDLTNIWSCFQQAMCALTFATRNPLSESSVVQFSDCALEMMLLNARQEYRNYFYYSDQIQKLVDYDAQTNSELMQTLKCFLVSERNSSIVQEQMHIARTTVFYRIRRIQEISGLDLDDPDTRLYCLLLFRLSEL